MTVKMSYILLTRKKIRCLRKDSTNGRNNQNPIKNTMMISTLKTTVMKMNRLKREIETHSRSTTLKNSKWVVAILRRIMIILRCIQKNIKA
jgi:hypothetical protein